MKEAVAEIERGERFTFGKNWNRFLELLNEERILEAERSLCKMLEVGNLEGRAFVDIGSGSGLFSLAARRLGANVHSFDFDPESVACTRELKARFFPGDHLWTIEAGSALDQAYLKSLGSFDIVYSWGVLHHTGALWNALENVGPLVKDGGKLFIAVYNDQGFPSRMWCFTKRLYNKAPSVLKFLILLVCFIRLWGPTTVKDILRGRPFFTWRMYGRLRGMSPWRDVVDWVGGYPFEVATPEQVFYFYRERGFSLTRLKTCRGGHGCNEFVFAKG